MNAIPVFKKFAPEWLIRFCLLLVVLPGLILFVLSISNVNAAAGFYGISPNDVQYTCIIFYSAMASFVALEGRFFKFMATKEYFLICTFLLILSCFLCYKIHSFALLLIIRYIQGMLTCGTLNITMTLMFSRLHSERAREIAYSVVYCILLSAIPLSTLITAPFIDAFSFNVIYKLAAFSYLPSAVLIIFCMNNVRFNRKLPLYQLDWPSFLIFTSCFALGGYLAVYGQQYDWFDDQRIVMASVLMFVSMVIFIGRQLFAKRPYINLKVFKIRNFLVGILLLFVLYLARGAFGVTTSFMGNVLGFDPIHIGYMMIYNISAIIVAVIISSRMVLAKKPVRMIFVYGFSLLMAFHIYMCFIFTTQVDSGSLILPVILQGLGVGMVMAPIILFVVSSSPAKYGSTGSAIGILVRFSGFCSSIAVTNYFQVYSQNDHINRFQEKLSALDPQALERLETLKQSMLSKGLSPDAASKISNSLLSKNIAIQAQVRYALDYYHMVIWLLLVVILTVILLPSINRTVIHLRARQAPSSI